METSSPPSSVQNMTTTRRTLVSAAAILGTFMAVMDISVVNVALPHMMGTFAEDLSKITWVATGYSIAEIIMSTMAGWWAALLGRRRLFLLSMALFAVGSILCGTATTFPQMIIYRVLQGIGGGTLIPVSLAILRDNFAQDRQGTAMAIYGMGVVLAPAFGPVIGGYLTDNYGWPAIFYINVPVSIVAIFLVNAFVVDPAHLRRGIRRVDWTGIALLTISLTSMQVVLERGEQKNWFESDFIIVGTIVTIVTLVLLIIWELRASDPVVNLRLLKNVPLSLGSGIGLIFGIALFGSTFMLPAFTQDILGYSAFDAGMVLMPRAAALFVVMPIAGFLYGKIDSRLLVAFGLSILVASFYGLGKLSLDAGFWNIIPMLMLMGVGMPFVFVILTSVSLSTVPAADTTEASSLYTLSRRIGGNIGYALVATMLARHSQVHHAALVDRVSQYDIAYRQFHDTATLLLIDRGVIPATASLRADALINQMINRQATMMSFNDVAWFMGLMFVVALPLVILLPGRPAKHRQKDGSAE